MKPDASTYKPDPAYLRGLIDRSGLTQEKAAALIGISFRAMRNYLSETAGRQAPYSVQFALECLANQ